MQRQVKIRARLWLLFIFLVLAGGHFLFFRFSWDPMNPYPLTRGLTIASTIWSTVLASAMMMRRGWARYVLAAWLVFAMTGFGLATLMVNKQLVQMLTRPTQEVIAGLCLYGLALTPRGISRSVRRYLAPRTAGGN
jgi:hypothetical protein